MRPVGAVRVGCCRDGGPPASPVPISAALTHWDQARRSPGGVQTCVTHLPPSLYFFLSSLQANGCRSNPVYERTPIPRQPHQLRNRRAGHDLAPTSGHRGQTRHPLLILVFFFPGRHFGNEPGGSVGKRRPFPWLCLKCLNLPIKSLFSRFVEGPPGSLDAYGTGKGLRSPAVLQQIPALLLSRTRGDTGT